MQIRSSLASFPLIVEAASLEQSVRALNLDLVALTIGYSPNGNNFIMPWRRTWPTYYTEA